jgi:hypothetical protein
MKLAVILHDEKMKSVGKNAILQGERGFFP